MVDFGCLFERFDPAIPLAADDPAYVDWQVAVGVPDVKKQLVNSIVLIRHSFIHRLFTGLRGGGKTTELRRLQEYLRVLPQGQRYFVSFVDADGIIDLDDANPTDLVLSVIRQLISDLVHEGIQVQIGSRLKDFLQAARDILQNIPDSGVDLKVGDPTGIIQLSTTLKRYPSLRRQVRGLLEGRLETLYDAINFDILPAVKAQLAQHGYVGVVVIVDQLDRISPSDNRHRTVFWEGRGKLKALNCHVIYTAPIEYAHSRALPALENEYGEILSLPLIPVNASDARVRKEALRLTKEIALGRISSCGIDEMDLFETSEILDQLARLSGGHIRSLFLLVRTAIETSGLNAPLTEAHINRVARRLATKYLDPLEGPERQVLSSVHATKSRPQNDAELEAFYDLLRDQYIFSYSVGGDRWYDWNPVLNLSELRQLWIRLMTRLHSTNWKSAPS